MQQQQNPSQTLLPSRSPGPAHTQAELDAIVLNRSELRHQLETVTEHRRELLQQSLQANGEMKKELETRVRALDDRSARLEQQILQADDAIADALARGVATQHRTSTGALPHFAGRDIMVIAGGEALVAALIGVAIYRLAWKRAKAKLGFSGAPADSASRFEQLQRSVDVIAVEVERISEGQRFVSKMLNEQGHFVGAGEAQLQQQQRKVAEPIRMADDSA